MIPSDHYLLDDEDIELIHEAISLASMAIEKTILSKIITTDPDEPEQPYLQRLQKLSRRYKLTDSFEDLQKIF